MHLNVRTLLNLPVFTESGAKLGRVVDAKLDVVGHQIIGYSVRANWFAPAEYFIKPAQVKSLTRERLVVEDSVLPERQTEKVMAVKPAPAGVLSGVMPRSEK